MKKTPISHRAAAALLLVLLILLAGCNGLQPGDRGLTEPLTAPPPTPSFTPTPTAGPGTATATPAPGTTTPTPTATFTPTPTPSGASPTPQPVPPTSPAMTAVAPPINAGETVTPAPGTPAAGTPAASGASFENPILRENFADPFLLKADDGYWYAYATNANGKNIQTGRSKDLLKWELLPDAMPALAKWAKPGGSLVWAPEVAKVAQNYVMYYTARDKASNKQCVGAAVSTKPEGKFKDTSDKPLVCQAKEGGTIDPDPFADGDKRYLYYKNDGNCCGIPTYIYAQELAPDGLSLVGEPVRLVRNDKQWEGSVIEAPTMFKHDGKYYLFYSANNYAGVEYAVGYATCEGPLGPCTDAPENPILKSQMQPPPNMVVGPGHQTIIQLDGQDWLVYHAWEVLAGGRRGDRRQMWMNRLDWQDGKPVVVGPLTGPQPAP